MPISDDRDGREEAERRRDMLIDELDKRAASLRDEADALREQLRISSQRLSELERRMEEVARRTETAEDTAEEALATAEEAGGGDDNGGNEAVGSKEPEQMPPSEDSEPFAYQVMESAGKIYCYLPKKPEGDGSDGGDGSDSDVEFCGGAYGGPHVGSSEEPMADADASPHASAGYKSDSSPTSRDPSISNIPDGLDFSWSHYGWYEVGSLDMDASDSEVEDKIVVATFKVPLDPDDGDSGEREPTEGPHLDSIELMDVDEWKQACKDSWEEYDEGAEATRKIPIALVANGLITQLCMGVPFVDRGGGIAGAGVKVDTKDATPTQMSIDWLPAGTGIDSDILQIYDFKDPTIGEHEYEVPTPSQGTGPSQATGPVFLIRETSTGNVAPKVVYKQLKFKLGANAVPPPYPPGYVPPEPPDPDDSDSDEPPEHIYIVIPNPDYDPDDSDSDNDNPWELFDISGFFWLRGGSAVTNYGTSLKLGNRANGYITISAV